MRKATGKFQHERSQEGKKTARRRDGKGRVTTRFRVAEPEACLPHPDGESQGCGDREDLDPPPQRDSIALPIGRSEPTQGALDGPDYPLHREKNLASPAVGHSLTPVTGMAKNCIKELVPQLQADAISEGNQLRSVPIAAPRPREEGTEGRENPRGFSSAAGSDGGIPLPYRNAGSLKAPMRGPRPPPDFIPASQNPGGLRGQRRPASHPTCRPPEARRGSLSSPFRKAA